MDHLQKWTEQFGYDMAQDKITNIHTKYTAIHRQYASHFWDRTKQSYRQILCRHTTIYSTYVTTSCGSWLLILPCNPGASAWLCVLARCCVVGGGVGLCCCWCVSQVVLSTAARCCQVCTTGCVGPRVDVLSALRGCCAELCVVM